jgi:hypothetical protein
MASHAVILSVVTAHTQSHSHKTLNNILHTHTRHRHAAAGLLFLGFSLLGRVCVCVYVLVLLGVAEGGVVHVCVSLGL